MSTYTFASTERRFLNAPVANAEQLQVLAVDPEYGELIRVMDQITLQDDKLSLLHYLTVTKNTLTEEPDQQVMQKIGHVRGVVLNSKNEVVCRSFGYTPEVPTGQWVEQLTENTVCYPACEGTVLRLFCYQEHWYLSTHHKMDAYKSFWAAKQSFGELFDQLCQFEYKDLDSTHCYSFLMSHPTNRQLFPVTRAQLMLIAEYDLGEQKFLSKPTSLNGVASPKPCQLPADLTRYQADRFDSTGFIVITNPNDPRPLRLVDQQYQQLRQARGNNPSLRSQYIQVRNTHQGQILREWFTEPEFQFVFAGVEAELTGLCTKLHWLYMQRHVHRVEVDLLPKEEDVLLKRCHSWHLENRETNKVTPEVVWKYIANTPGIFLLRMLNRLRREFFH